MVSKCFDTGETT